MVRKSKYYHSYTKDMRYLISAMHPSHIVNSLAVIQEGRHRKYYVGDPVYTGLVEQLLTSIKSSSRKRGLANATIKASRQEKSRRYPTLDRLREIAKTIVRSRGFVAADSLRSVAEGVYGVISGKDLCPVFRNKDFVSIGNKPSCSPSAHGREIRVYVLA